MPSNSLSILSPYSTMIAMSMVVLSCHCLVSATTTAYPPPEVEFPTHEALLEAAFDAIKYLHSQMDDDHSGSVDLTESGGFIKEELSQVRAVYRGLKLLNYVI